MDLNTAAASLGLAGLKAAFKKLKGKLSADQQKKLISSAVKELLQMHPDIDSAEASLLAADATGAKPSPELLRAKRMLSSSKSHAYGRKKPAKKRPAKKKVAKKKVAKKKMAK